jgi:hypothetical protein
VDLLLPRVIPDAPHQRREPGPVPIRIRVLRPLRLRLSGECRSPSDICHNPRPLQRLLPRPAGDQLRRPVGRRPCLEGRRQGLCDRRLGRRQARLHVQDIRPLLRGAEGPAGPSSGAVSRLARHEMDSALRRPRPVRRGARGLSPPVPPNRLARPAEEEAARARTEPVVADHTSRDCPA